MIIKEICLENYTLVPKALELGAKRIELCDNLAVGGTTVSNGVMAQTIKYAHEKKVPVTILIRPRGGNFIYDDTELKIMEKDIFTAQELGADCVAFGALTKDNTLDFDAMENLAAASGGMQLEINMAFDALTLDAQKEAIDWAVSQGFDRILTHGGPFEQPLDTCLDNLKETIAYAKQRIAILPGGGITFANFQEIAETLQVKEVHGTRLLQF
ncbi:copper homeostasis protein [Ligilactobacillus sp. WC1T17]|uniref:PF03932 family protein CutC n=1 Tax=Ligilactobacillus ruminis TaxID=1623 RepID=A0ABY1A9X2_9LACO|nr:copper homeostasis protein [Ligilactobacillus ruminis]